LTNKGVSTEKHYLTDTVAKAEKLKKRDKKNITFGWNKFNDDAIYRAYEKRVDRLQRDEIEDSHLTEEEKNKLEQERLDRLVEDINQQDLKRSQYKRRRLHVEEQTVDYINERNRKFNRKLERNFGKHAAEFKANLEWGSKL